MRIMIIGVLLTASGVAQAVNYVHTATTAEPVRESGQVRAGSFY